MKASEREFIQSIRSQLHDDTISISTLQLASERACQEKQAITDYKEIRAKEKEISEIYARGEIPEERRKAHDEALMELVRAIEPQCKAYKTNQALWMDILSSSESHDEEGLEKIERLLEIEENKTGHIEFMLALAEEAENEFLIEKYQKEKAENEKNIQKYHEIRKSIESRS